MRPKWTFVIPLLVLMASGLEDYNRVPTPDEPATPSKSDMLMEPKKGVDMPADDPRMLNQKAHETYPVPTDPHPTGVDPQANYQIPPPPVITSNPHAIVNDPGHLHQLPAPPPPPPSYQDNNFNVLPYVPPPVGNRALKSPGVIVPPSPQYAIPPQQNPSHTGSNEAYPVPPNIGPSSASDVEYLVQPQNGPSGAPNVAYPVPSQSGLHVEYTVPPQNGPTGASHVIYPGPPQSGPSGAPNVAYPVPSQSGLHVEYAVPPQNGPTGASHVIYPGPPQSGPSGAPNVAYARPPQNAPSGAPNVAYPVPPQHSPSGAPNAAYPRPPQNAPSGAPNVEYPRPPQNAPSGAPNVEYPRPPQNAPSGAPNGAYPRPPQHAPSGAPNGAYPRPPQHAPSGAPNGAYPVPPQSGPPRGVYPAPPQSDPKGTHNIPATSGDFKRMPDQNNYPALNNNVAKDPVKVEEAKNECSFDFNRQNEFNPSSKPVQYPEKMKTAYKGSIAEMVFEKFINKDSLSSVPRSGINGRSQQPGLGFQQPPQPSQKFRTPPNKFARPSLANSNPVYSGSNPVYKQGVFDDGGIHNMFNNINSLATQRFQTPQPPAFPDSQFQPGRPFKFGFGLGSAKRKTNPFGGDPFSEQTFQFRKKRMAGFGPPSVDHQVEPLCAPETKETLTSFTKYGGNCILWEPEKQAINFVTCKNTTCDFCTDKRSTSKCMAGEIEMHVWVYCERGPMPQQIVLDTVKIPEFCTCKVYNCST